MTSTVNRPAAAYSEYRQLSPSATMRRVSLRNLATHKVRLALTVVSVVLGTAFIAGSFVFTDTLKHTFDGIFADTAQGVDVEVTTRDSGASGVPVTAVTTIKGIAGVRSVEPTISGQIVLIAADGRAAQGGGAPSVGQAYLPPAQQLGDPYTFVAGHAPRTAGEIALNSGAVRLAGLHLGQRTEVVLPARGPIAVTVVGIYSTASETGGYIGALFTEAQAGNLFTDGSYVSSVEIAAAPGVSPATLRSRVAQALPEYKVRTGQQVRDDTNKSVSTALSFVNALLLAFGAIALLVGTFIIYNTFSMIVAQRTRELALLRAIGASRRQVGRSVRLEAAVVGLVGSVIGLAGGVGLAYGLRALLNSFDVGLPSGPLQLQLRTVVVTIVVGVVVTVLSAVAPARRAARVAPVAAMRSELGSTGKSLRRRTILGAVLAATGVAAVASGALGRAGAPAASLVGAGALLLILGVLLAGPSLSRPIVTGLGAVVGRPFGAVGRLARTNATRVPRRTAATAFALTLGLMLVATIAVFGASAKQSVNRLVDNTIRADYLLTGPDSIGVPVGTGTAAAAVAGVQDIVSLHALTLRFGPASAGTSSGTAVDGPLAQVVGYRMVAGAPTLSADTMLVSQGKAAAEHWTVGRTVTLTGLDGRHFTQRIGGVYADDDLLGPWLVDEQLYEQAVPAANRDDIVVLVKAAPGTDLAGLRAGLEQATARLLVVQVQDRHQFKGTVASKIDSLLAIVYGLLALAVVIAVLGIVNTLALSVIERRRELGMLRALGMVRGQVRRTIYLESVLIALFGAVVGVVLGIGFGAAFVRTLRDQGLDTVSVPWSQTVLFVLVAGAVGVAAALLPAVRAARTAPLAAIADG